MEENSSAEAVVIRAAAARWGVEIKWYESGASFDDYYNRHLRRLEAEAPEDWIRGPSDANLSMKGNLVFGIDAAAPDVFHELMHVVIGPPSLEVDEGYVLLPFEWHMAKMLAPQMARRGRRFLEGVRHYQDVTSVAEELYSDGHPVVGEIGSIGRPRATRWWRNGLRRAQRLGLLDESLEPTWRRAVWRNSGVTATKKWSIDTDRRYV